MVCVKEVPAELFIEAYADHLSKKLALPEWVDLVKTASFKELPPYDANWYYIRAASICRKLYFREDIGVGMFRKLYGGKHKCTIKAGHGRRAAGGLIRHILQQLEKTGLVERSVELKGGRKLSPSGQRDMDLVAGSVHYESDFDTMFLPPPAVHAELDEGAGEGDEVEVEADGEEE